MFDTTAQDYDRMESILGLGSGSWYRGQALERAGLRAGMRVVDVGTGTGLVAREAARICGNPANVTGVDPSVGMMAHARVPEGVNMVEGVAEAIPSPDSHYDFLSMGYALRHVVDLRATFQEYRRVLAPGGRLLILEVTPPRSRLSFHLLKLYLGRLVPLVARLGRGGRMSRDLMRYYWETIETCVAPPVIVAALNEAGFSQIERRVEMAIFSEYVAVR
jgi:demethylmenaquinone methyltransferase/2-methoxy-6-polyprenyl-1,4-benzoquinol methylase